MKKLSIILAVIALIFSYNAYARTETEINTPNGSTCPMFSPPSPEMKEACAAKGGILVGQKNEMGCPMPPICKPASWEDKKSTSTEHKMPEPTMKPMPIAANGPELLITPSGEFKAKNMTVKSISGNTFTGEIWGTVWTVKMPADAIYTPAGETQKTTNSIPSIGSLVMVMGQISKDTPGTVIAKNVKPLINPGASMPDTEKKIVPKPTDINKPAINQGMIENLIRELLKKISEIQAKLEAKQNQPLPQ